MSEEKKINLEEWCKVMNNLINETPLTAQMRNGMLQGLQDVYDIVVSTHKENDGNENL